MTDETLKLQLAKMLPEKIYWNDTFQAWTWMNSTSPLPDVPVLDTEWLHVCWLCEQSLDKRECDMFANYLGQLVDKAWIDVGATRVVTSTKVVSASWQQRAEALCKVKGITP